MTISLIKLALKEYYTVYHKSNYTEVVSINDILYIQNCFTKKLKKLELFEGVNKDFYCIEYN